MVGQSLATVEPIGQWRLCLDAMGFQKCALDAKHHGCALVCVKLKVRVKGVAVLGSVTGDMGINSKNDDTDHLWLNGETWKENGSKKPMLMLECGCALGAVDW